MKTEQDTITHQVRQSQRANLDLYINKIIGDEPHLARVRDISDSGVFLYKLLEPREKPVRRIGLEIQLPTSDEIIWALGEVVRDEPGEQADGVGVRFTRIAEHDRQLIREYVANHRHLAGSRHAA